MVDSNQSWSSRERASVSRGEGLQRVNHGGLFLPPYRQKENEGEGVSSQVLVVLLVDETGTRRAATDRWVRSLHAPLVFGESVFLRVVVVFFFFVTATIVFCTEVCGLGLREYSLSL